MNNSTNLLKWGSGESVVVFLHYFGGSASSWQWVTEPLSKHYQCIAINLPGFGSTPALENPSVVSLAHYVIRELKELNINSYSLVGHSMGGKIAVQIAALEKHSVKELILIAPSPPTIERMTSEEKERMLNHPNRSVAEETVSNVVLKPLCEEQFRLAVDTQLVIDEVTWRWWLLEGMNHSIADQVSKVVSAVTVISSKDDPAITYSMVKEEIMPVLSQARLITTSGLGHLLPLEDPEWLVAQLNEILS